MPLQQALPTWLALNAANFASPSGLVDLRTGQPQFAGGLNVGDYFDLTEKEANSLSNTAVGLLHWGRYRFVQVTSVATAANVKLGTAAMFGTGTILQGVIITGAGSGQTNGTYIVAASGGGGTGASAQVVVSGGAVTAATVLSPGAGYTSVPTFTVAAGGTPGTIVAQMAAPGNLVTSYDVSYGSAFVHGVFLNSITPGNYGFIQEGGIATVLANASVTASAIGNVALPKASGAGTWDTITAASAALVTAGGVAWDAAIASELFRIQLRLPAFQD